MTSDNLASEHQQVAPARTLLRAWNLFKSLKMGLFLLSLICAVCIYGTMFYAANKVYGDNAIPMAKARVFNAWWFFSLLGLFFVQFVISTWHVTKMSFGIWSKRDFSRSRDYLTIGRNRANIEVPDGPDHIERVLRRRFTRAHRDGNRFFAHAGLRQRIGPTIVHAGIVVILLAGLCRIYLDRKGYVLSEGRFIGSEGETVSHIFRPRYMDQVMGPTNVEALRIPYEITVLDFDEIFHANSNNPAYFSSLIKIKDVRTGRVTVAKLDMNHSASVGGFEFHQAGYQPIPPMQAYRMNYDVRDAITGERIAVTDASPETRVQVGDEDLFLEVDGEVPGAPYRLYTSANPTEPIEQGTLLASNREQTLTIRLRKFYPHFDVTSEGARTLSNAPVDPAAEADLFVDGAPAGPTILFYDAQKTAMVPPFRGMEIKLEDVLYKRTEADNFDEFNWTDPKSAQFVVAVRDRETSEVLARAQIGVGETSAPISFISSGDGPQAPPEAAQYAVYPLGRATRYTTILSVVREPVVNYYIAGVALIAIGALMTFTSRYRALYGLWDEEQQRFLFALIPRFGREANPREFARLVEELSGVPQGPTPGDEPVTETEPENELLPAG